jgi:hypothetical protein
VLHQWPKAHFLTRVLQRHYAPCFICRILSWSFKTHFKSSMRRGYKIHPAGFDFHCLFWPYYIY